MFHLSRPSSSIVHSTATVKGPLLTFDFWLAQWFYFGTKKKTRNETEIIVTFSPVESHYRDFDLCSRDPGESMIHHRHVVVQVHLTCLLFCFHLLLSAVFFWERFDADLTEQFRFGRQNSSGVSHFWHPICRSRNINSNWINWNVYKCSCVQIM